MHGEAAGAKELEAGNAAKADKKQQGGSLRHKVWPASASMKMPKEETEMSPLIKATMEKIHFMRDDKLSYKERQGLSKSQFALPGKGEGPEGKQGGSYPIPDESHARNALARVSQHGTTAEKAKVKSAVEKKFPDIEVGESKEAQAGERDVGTDAYANYVAGLTPGQEPDPAVKSKDAKKASAESKKATDERERQATRIDDEYVPTLEEYATHLESLDEVALEAELETLSQNELLEILGTGLVKKAAKGIVNRFSTQGRLKAAKKKGAKIKAKTDLATTKTSNIAAKAGLKKARAAHKAAKGPSKIGGALRKVVGAAPKKPAAPAAAPAKPAAPAAAPAKPKLKLAAEYDPETLVGRAMLELSKKTLGSYVKKAATDKANAGIDLGVSSQKKGGQTRKDVDTHVGKMIKRDNGISKAVDKLSK